MDSKGNVLDFVVDEVVNIAEIVVNAVIVDILKATLSLLSDSARALVKAIFFERLSEREVRLHLGVTQSVGNKRKAKILAKLKKIIENGFLRCSAPCFFLWENEGLLPALSIFGLSNPDWRKKNGIQPRTRGRKWHIWKQAEEKLLRTCGVDEAIIEQIRTDDRADFNSNRRFY